METSDSSFSELQLRTSREKYYTYIFKLKEIRGLETSCQCVFIQVTELCKSNYLTEMESKSK